jgi:DNA-directed RNA polymerase specialized sigma24 family protein
VTDAHELTRAEEAQAIALIPAMFEELRGLRAELAALVASQAPRLVSPAEAAKALGISIATCRRRIADQTLPSRHIGRRVLVDLSNARPARQS